MKVAVTFDTGHPARLPPIDGAVAFVWQDERPLRGLAARADWRLNGFLSRLLIEQRFAGERGDWLLVPTQGRLPFTALFLVGMGRRTEHGEERARLALETVAVKVALAGLHGLAIDLADIAVPSFPPEAAMVRFLESLGAAYPKDEFERPVYHPAIEAKKRNEARLDASRKRRAEMIDARKRWDAEQRQSPSPGSSSETDSTSLPSERGRGARPVAGQVPSTPPEPPPDPSSIPEPELEKNPERTVSVVLLGEPRTVSAMRAGLKAGRKAGSRLDVEWAG